MIGRKIHNRYRIVKPIGAGGMGMVWLAISTQNGTSENQHVAIKILDKKNSSNHIVDIIRFKNEAMLISRIDHPHIVKIYEVGETENEYYITMEYINGSSLSELIAKENRPFPIKDIIDIMIQICSGLEQIHSCRLIHRDLKTSNIVIDRATQQVKLIDFGLAELKEFSETISTDIISGTFNYMSPEQIGKTKGTIDERSDLYSLGIIFYELLTGRPPFSSTSLHSLIHQHLAKIPEPPRIYNKEACPLLEHIVLKLLKKDPEKRYQSASGLLYDLTKYKNGLNDFIPGTNDKILLLNYRTSLTGRDSQWSAMQNALSNAIKGYGSLCFIYGEAGSGKTRLIEELRNIAQSNKHIFLYAKCFSGDIKTPYGPFNDILNQYLKIFSSYENQKKTKIREKISTAIGKTGEILIRLSPFMDEILGECPPLIELKPDRENQRFLMIISKFFYALSIIEKRVIIVLDDLQWADEGSLLLLNELMEEIPNTSLLLIGAYRNNEIPETHGIKRILRKSVEKFYPLTKIPLNPFTPDIMNTFIASLLHEDEEHTITLSGLIYKKSLGNPYFTIEIVKHLVQQQAIIYNNKNKLLIQDIKLSSIDLPNSIIAILVQRISLLNDKQKLFLAFAAIIGKKFSLPFMFQLSKEAIELGYIDKEEIVQLADKAISLQLLVTDPLEHSELSFTHDRIREACYNLTCKEKRIKLHLKIANTIEMINKPLLDKDIDSCDCIFDLAYHYIEGRNKEKILQYAYPAGLKAKDNYANEEAMKYLDIVIIIIEGELLKNETTYCRTLWIECMLAISEIYLRIGGNDAAIGLYEMALPYVDQPIKKSMTYKQISEAYFKKGDWKKCEEHGRIGLQLIGERLPGNKITAILCIAKELIIQLAHNILPIFFILKNESKNSEVNKITFWFYYGLGWSYILSDRIKFIHLSLKYLNFTESRIGPSRELGMALASYGCLLSLIRLPFKYGHNYLNKSLALRKYLHDQWGMGQTYQFLAYICQWNAMFHDSIDFFTQSVRIFTEIGDMREMNMSIMGLSHIYRYISDYEKALTHIEQFHDISHKTKDNMGIASALLNKAEIFIEKGDYNEASHYAKKCHELSYAHNIWLIYCIANIDLGVIAMEDNDSNKALEHLQTAKKLHKENHFLGQYIVYLYSCLAEAYMAAFINSSHNVSNKDKKNSLKKIRKACNTALVLTRPWKTHHASALRVSAKYYALIGKNSKAEKFFKNSIILCETIGRKYELGRCHYEYGKYLKSITNKIDAKENLHKAYAIFKELDSKVYLERTASLLNIRNEETTPPLNRFIERLTKDKKYASLVEITNDISSDMSHEQILDRVLAIAMEITGAKCGYIIIKDKEDVLDIVASKNINVSQSSHFSKGIVEQVFEKGECVLTTNATEEEYSNMQSVVYHDLKSILAVPIKYRNTTEGVCYLDNALARGIFTQDDSDTLQVFMNTVSFVIHDVFFNNTVKNTGKSKHNNSFFEQHEITNREKEIIQFLAEGNTNKVISEKMNISVRTVDTHIYKIYKKIGIKNRWELLERINNC